MFVNSQNYDDIRKYFQHTFVKFKETGDHIWHIDIVNPKEIICSDKNKEEVGIDLEIGYNLEYILPRKAVFQFGNNATMLARIPARQWKKGLCKANTAFSRLEGDGSWINLPFDAHIIEGFVNKPSYYSLDMAIQSFKNDTSLASVSLTPRIAVTMGGKVFVDSVLVAKASFAESKILCKKLFHPELSKVFSGFTFQLV